MLQRLPWTSYLFVFAILALTISIVRSPGIGGVQELTASVCRRVSRGERFAALLGRGDPATGSVLTALLAHDDGVTPLAATLPTGVHSYPGDDPAGPGAF